jgi:hypothetical protein
MRTVMAAASKEYPNESCPPKLENMANSRSTTATYLSGPNRRYGLLAVSPIASGTP